MDSHSTLSIQSPCQLARSVPGQPAGAWTLRAASFLALTRGSARLASSGQLLLSIDRLGSGARIAALPDLLREEITLRDARAPNLRSVGIRERRDASPQARRLGLFADRAAPAGQCAAGATIGNLAPFASHWS